MFGFGKKDKSLKFEDKLIAKFKDDHKDLIILIGKIQKSCDDHNPVKARKHLTALKLDLLGHFMEEDIKLYWYLEDIYKNNESIFTLVKSFETSIKDIQRDVIKFLDFYVDPDSTFDGKFRRDFTHIVESLTIRMESEEKTLYTLYQKQ